MTQTRFGLIGHPIAHSLSPALFRAGYDGRYPYDLIEFAGFEDAYSRFLSDYQGINVTAPFKESAFAKADILSEECELIKATNLLIKTPDGVKAYNSDYLGVRMWLEETAPRTSKESLKDIKVLIVGTGGAGKAAAIAAASLGMNVTLINRDTAKAEAVAGNIARMQHAPDTSVHPLSCFRECFREADIIIYNIPTAIQELTGITADDFGTDKPKFILEANYKNPSFTKELTDMMNEANPLAEYTSGKVWLLYQALTGYEIFTGEKPDLASMSAVL